MIAPASADVRRMAAMADQLLTRVELLAAPDEWDAFVQASPDATFFHRAGWKDVLEQSFGFRSHYLAARRDGRVVGVLPLCELRPPFGRPRLVSLPFAVEAGISAIDDAARRALEEAAIGHAEEIGAGSLELRDGLEGEAFHVQRELYCRFRRRLASSDGENFARIPRKQRRMIRLGQRSGLRACVDADIDVFYDLYARSQRRLGTPLLPRQYFAALREHFADDSMILTVWLAETAVASVLSFLFNDQILPYYAGSREEYFHHAINDYMYWDLMRLARQRGITTFDFGRSRRDSGAFHYKRHWGFEPEPLGYRVRSFGPGRAQRRTVDDPRLRALRWGWKRLPLAMTTKIGPLLARRFAAYFT